jgi:hypothetical protein
MSQESTIFEFERKSDAFQPLIFDFESAIHATTHNPVGHLIDEYIDFLNDTTTFEGSSLKPTCTDFDQYNAGFVTMFLDQAGNTRRRVATVNAYIKGVLLRFTPEPMDKTDFLYVFREELMAEFKIK